MQIDSIQLFRLPLLRPDEAEPAARSTGDPNPIRESILACLQSGRHVGFGEVALPTAPLECDEWSAAAFMCLRDWLAPALAGRSLDSGEALQEALAPYQGNSAAKSALDVAWWSLASLARDKPLCQLLGAQRNTVPISQTLGVPHQPEQLLNDIDEALARRYDHVTLKLRPGWDVEMLRAVRQRFPDQPIAVDCDGRCTLAQQEMFYRFEDFFLKYIEQPFAADDLVAHAMLQENLRTPIALDQGVVSPARVEQALDLGACRIVRIDLARVGGITPALAIRAACDAANTACVVGGGPQNGVAALATAAVAMLCNAPVPATAFRWRPQPWLTTHAQVALNPDNDRPEARLPDDVAGLGVSIDLSALRAFAIEQAAIG